MNTWSLAWRFLQRDWHRGELRVLVIALLIAVASMTSVSLFTKKIELAMTEQAGQFLGADLLLRGPNAIGAEVISEAKHIGLETSSAINFSSVVVANDEFQLAHIKAVDQSYPLRSSIRISLQLYGEEIDSTSGPSAGEVWLEPRLFSLLSLQLGDLIELGETRLKVTAVLKNDPGGASSFMAIAPKILMHLDDIEKTRIIQPGSRVTYQLGLAGSFQKRKQFEDWLKPQLLPSQILAGGSESSEALGTAMSKAEQYLSLASMLSVMLSGIAIAMAANRYSYRHFDQAALLRCMGASQKKIISLFSLQLIMIASLAGLLGCLVGYLSQQGLLLILKSYLAPDLPSAGMMPLVNGFLSGFIVLTGFSLPAVLRLKAVSPLRILRRDLAPLPMRSLLVYAIAIGSMVFLMWWHSGQLKLTLLVVAGVLITILILLFLSVLLMSSSSALTGILRGAWRTGLQQILRHKKDNRLQMLSFGLSLMILMTIFLLRTDLISRWQAQIPDEAPNHFVMNIQSYEVEPLRAFLQAQQIPAEGLYPMVRGRISHINSQPVDGNGDKNELDPALKRELNLSWADKLQVNNKLVEGHWWQPSENSAVISVERELARRLGVGIGDELTFQISDQSITARIKNLREVQWDSFQPNFYVIFPDKIINQFPVSYISSFYLPKQNKNVLNSLVRSFPTLTVLEVDAIIDQVQSILQQVSQAVEYVMLFVLFAGMMVLIASMQSSMDERVQNAVVMRTLGAKRSFLQNAQLSEFIMLGLFSGLLAVISTELIAWLLYSRVFSLEFDMHWWLWFSGPSISVVLILLLSYAYMRKVTRQSPLKILRYS